MLEEAGEAECLLNNTLSWMFKKHLKKQKQKGKQNLYRCSRTCFPGPGTTRTHLLNRALSLEEDASAQQLREDAAHWPDVDGRAVVSAAHEHLRRPVVLRHHLLGHVTGRVGLLHPRQAEITNLNRRQDSVRVKPTVLQQSDRCCRGRLILDGDVGSVSISSSLFHRFSPLA